MGKPKFRVSKPYSGRRKNKNLRRIIEGSEKTSKVGPREESSYLSSTGKKFEAFGVTQEFISKHSCYEGSNLEDSKDCFLLSRSQACRVLLEGYVAQCQAVGYMKSDILEGCSQGLSVKLQITCENCHLYCSEQFTSGRLSNSNRVPFEVNTRAVLAFRNIGCGFSAMRDWFSNMNFPNCMSKDAYCSSHSKLGDASKATFEEILASSRKAIKTAYKDVGVIPDEQGILDVAVSFDGSWQKRGHSSHNGMASVIELMTGLPLDYEVLSNYCQKCKLAEGEKSEEYMSKHSKNCLKNFDGSANAMEVECALRMWKRSIEKNGMRYTTMLCDGDSKSFDAVTEAKVYGPDVEIEKEDCVSHISKWLGTALRNLASESKAQGLSVTGKGKLTHQKIMKIQNYYGRAIKDHHDDIPLLKQQIFAILMHLSSSDRFPKHQHCPPGERSWCF